MISWYLIPDRNASGQYEIKSQTTYKIFQHLTMVQFWAVWEWIIALGIITKIMSCNVILHGHELLSVCYIGDSSVFTGAMMK